MSDVHDTHSSWIQFDTFDINKDEQCVSKWEVSHMCECECVCGCWSLNVSSVMNWQVVQKNKWLLCVQLPPHVQLVSSQMSAVG